MATGIVYQQLFKDVNDGLYRTDIYDLESEESDVTTVIQLEPTGQPLNLSTIDNSEDKFSPIRSQQLTISFLSRIGLSLEQFADGPDDRFLVESYYNGSIFFRGFLSLSDNSEAFLPPSNTVTLTATDKLGALKEIPLVDFNGNNPAGKYRIIELLAMALRLTGQELNINVIHNLKPGGGSIGPISVSFQGGNEIRLPSTYSRFFYAGQILSVTGTGSNNGTFTVVSTGFVGATPVAYVTPAVLGEVAIAAVVSDQLSDKHIYDQCFLDARTFEEEINETEDAYTVIEKILGYDCSLFYWQGSWWIQRVNEREKDVQRWASYTPTGEFTGFIEGSFNHQVGVNESNWFANEATQWRPTREVGEVKLTLGYEYPEELICNQDFSRGTTVPEPTGIGIETFELVPECIEYLREGSPSTYATLDQPPFAGSRGVLIKKYEGGLEKESYLQATIAGGFRHYFKLQPLDVGVKDKLEIGFNYRSNGDNSLTNVYPALVVLLGDDGTTWEWTYDQPAQTTAWVLRTSGNAPFAGGWHADLSGLNAEEWQGISSTSDPLPVSGRLIIRLVSANAGYSMEFSDLNITYIPFINGSYPRYTGQANIVKRTDPDRYLSRIDETVFIGDAPAKAMKGAIFVLNNLGRYDLINVFTENGVPQRFGWHQVQAVWNQYRNAVRVFEYDIVADPTYLPHLIHRYEITDLTGATLNRYFIMITFEMDLRLGALVGNMPEIYRIDLGKVYTDPFTFKYVTK